MMLKDGSQVKNCKAEAQDSHSFQKKEDQKSSPRGRMILSEGWDKGTFFLLFACIL